MNIHETNESIGNLKIIRPFNVSGKHQRRGVVFDMVKDAVENGKIWYSMNTTRTLTSSEFAKSRSADLILSDKSGVFNLSEGITLTMEALANEIRDRIGGSIELEAREADPQIQFRQTTRLSEGYDRDKLAGIIDEVYSYVKEHYVRREQS